MSISLVSIWDPSAMITRRSRPWLRLSLDRHHVSFLGRLEQRAEVDCRAWWWPDSPPHRAALHPLSWQKWWVWSVQAARGAVSPCPVQWPSSGSGWRGRRTHGRADGCDLQREQSSHEFRQHSDGHSEFTTEQMIHIVKNEKCGVGGYAIVWLCNVKHTRIHLNVLDLRL